MVRWESERAEGGRVFSKIWVGQVVVGTGRINVPILFLLPGIIRRSGGNSTFDFCVCVCVWANPPGFFSSSNGKRKPAAFTPSHD